MDQEVSTRVQQALEQIGEDEALTSDLTDPAATALLDWITQQIKAADAAADDQAFQSRVTMIRSAARTAAKTAAEEDVTAAVVVERAQAAVDASLVPVPASPAVTPVEPVDPPAPTPGSTPSAIEVPSAASDSLRAGSARQSSVWNSLRRRLRRWVHRKV